MVPNYYNNKKVVIPGMDPGSRCYKGCCCLFLGGSPVACRPRDPHPVIPEGFCRGRQPLCFYIRLGFPITNLGNDFIK